MGRAYGTKLTDNLKVAEGNSVRGDTYPFGVLYRVEAVRYSYTVDADREEYGVTAPQLELFAFRVHKFTQHGATLCDEWSGARRRWVDLRPNAKQWASQSASEAIEQFAHRRKAQLYILRKQVGRASDELALAEGLIRQIKEGQSDGIAPQNP